MGRWGLHGTPLPVLGGCAPILLLPTSFLPKNRMKVGSRISIVFRQYASETQRRIQKLLVECRTQKLLCCIHQLQCRIQELIQPVPQFSKFGSTFLPKNRMKVGSRISIVFRQYASETQRRIQKLLVECRTQKLLCCIHQLQCRIQELIQPVPQFSKFGSTTVQGWFKVDMG